jgi:CPA1 family monovalent cation:H+ antiporter
MSKRQSSPGWVIAADASGAPARATCRHLDMIRDVVPSTTLGCEDCLREGTAWVHLRECLTCGHIGCCDSSPRRHARAHWLKVDHPIVRSFEPGEDWAWCYADELFLMPAS